MVESLVELHRIIEYRGGAVYRTAYVGQVWVAADEVPPPGHQYVALSTAWYTANPDQQTVRLRRP